MRATRAEDLHPDTLTELQNIVNACRTCQSFQRRKMTFSHRLKTDYVFNRMLLIDVVHLDGKPGIYTVHKDTGYGAASFFTLRHETQQELRYGTLSLRAGR